MDIVRKIILNKNNKFYIRNEIEKKAMIMQNYETLSEYAQNYFFNSYNKFKFKLILNSDYRCILIIYR